MMSLLLDEYLPGVEFDKHGPISLKLAYGYRETEIIQEQELELQMIQF